MRVTHVYHKCGTKLTVKPTKYRDRFPDNYQVITEGTESYIVPAGIFGDRIAIGRIPEGAVMELKDKYEIVYSIAAPERHKPKTMKVSNQKHYLFFDLETTGSNPTKDRIVQLYAVKLDQDRKPIEPGVNLYFNPGMPIPAEATAVHHITDEMVKNAPTFASCTKELWSLFSNVALCGFNIKGFDLVLLSEEFGRAGIDWPTSGLPVIDMWKIYVKNEPRNLAAAYRHYCGHELDGAHDASVDVAATIGVFLSQMERHQDLTAMDQSQLHEYCADGSRNLDLAGKIVLNNEGVPVYAFGKNKDKPVLSDKKYAEWMLTGEFSHNTKAVVRQLLAK